jgi:S-adenosylmethionine hydrolase
MSRRHDTISFLSDYGLADEFVGVVKSVIRSIAPHVTVIDITHDIAAHDVRAGGLALARSAQYLVPGVVLAVVDPGVGSDRRAVAVEVGGGESVLVGPDNGLLAPAVAMVGGATRAVSLTNDEYHLDAPGATFDGRDVFAPAAAHLCTGIDLAELGDVIEPSSLVPGVLPLSRDEGGALVAEVLWVDRFGNAQLNVDPDDVESFGDRLRLVHPGGSRTAIRSDTYDSVRVGEVGLVVDSYGLLSVAVNRASAADELGLRAGDEVTLEKLTGEETAVASPVTLRGRGEG